MSKNSNIIIENKSDLLDADALELAQVVVSRGRVSENGRAYSGFTEIKVADTYYEIHYSYTNRSDRFTVLNSKNQRP